MSDNICDVPVYYTIYRI